MPYSKTNGIVLIDVKGISSADHMGLTEFIRLKPLRPTDRPSEGEDGEGFYYRGYFTAEAGAKVDEWLQEHGIPLVAK